MRGVPEVVNYLKSHGCSSSNSLRNSSAGQYRPFSYSYMASLCHSSHCSFVCGLRNVTVFSNCIYLLQHSVSADNVSTSSSTAKSTAGSDALAGCPKSMSLKSFFIVISLFFVFAKIGNISTNNKCQVKNRFWGIYILRHPKIYCKSNPLNRKLSFVLLA